MINYSLMFLSSIVAVVLMFACLFFNNKIFKTMIAVVVISTIGINIVALNMPEPTGTITGTVTKYKNNVLVIDDVNAYHLFDTSTTVPALCKVLEPGDYVEITYTETANYVADCRVISKAGKDDMSNQNQSEKDYAEADSKTYSENQ